MKTVGRVCVAIDKEGNERFLNLIRANSIRVDNVCVQNEKIIFWIDSMDFFQLKKIYKKTGIRPVIISKRGIIFKIKRILKKKSVIAGVLVFFMIIYTATRFLWNIKVEDNYIFSREEIVEVLNDNNIDVGLLLKKVDCSEIENLLRIKYNDISWVSARIEGCTLIIQIKENVPKEGGLREFDREEGSLVAPCDGTIDYIVTAKGTPKVKKGDVVTKGQILIDGKIEITDDYGENIGFRTTLAEGDVYITGDYYYESRINIKHKIKNYAEGKSLYYIRIGDKKLILYKPFNISSNCDIINSECQLQLNNDVLKKIHFGTVRYLEYSTKDVEYSDTQAKELLVNELNDNIDELRKKEIFVKDYSLAFTKDEQEMKLAGDLLVLVRARDYADIVYDNNEKGAEINVGN